MKEIFNFVSSHNIDLHLYYVPSKLNDADAPSRQLSLADSTLDLIQWILWHLILMQCVVLMGVR